MAITNAQQYKQLVNPPLDGKRPGYRGDAAYRSKSAQSSPSAGGQGNVGTKSDFGDGDASKGFDQSAKPGEQDSNVYGVTGKQYDPQKALDIAKKAGAFDKKYKQKKTLKQKFVTPTQKVLYNVFPNNPKNEKAYVKYLQSLGVNVPSDLLTAIEEEDKKLSFDDFQKLVGYEPDFMLPGEEGLFQPMNFAEYMASKGNFNLITGGNVGNLKDFKNPGGIIDPKTGLPMTDFEFEKLKQSSSQYNPGGDDGPNQQMDPCKGPNPPAYCNIDPPSDPTDPSTPSTGVFAGIAPRFAGSIFDFDALRAGAMDGGIMNNQVMGGMADGNIDEAGRQMYFLGKLVKKATELLRKLLSHRLVKLHCLQHLF